MMQSKKITRYATFALIYFAQGAIMGYFTALNAIYLQSFGLNMSLIGIVGTIAMLPFVLKIFLGMLSDKVNFLNLGFRKPYIVIGLLVQMVCLLLVPAIRPDQNFWLFALLAFLLQTGMALYDTCTDGLALDTTAKEEEGTIQGFMVGGRALGVITVGLIGVIAENVSWQIAFYALAVLTILPFPWLLTNGKEAPRSSQNKFDWKAFKAFGKRSVIALGTLGALYSLSTNGVNELINPFLSETYHMQVSTAGVVTMAWGAGVVLGGLTGGKLVDRLGHRKSVVWAMGIAFTAILLLAFIFNPAIAWIFVPVFGLAYGYYETVYFAVSMNASDLRIAASMFAILMAVANIGTAIGLSLAGILADLAGYRIAFIVMAGVNLLAIPLLPLIFNEKVSEIHTVQPEEL